MNISLYKFIHADISHIHVTTFACIKAFRLECICWSRKHIQNIVANKTSLLFCYRDGPTNNF